MAWTYYTVNHPDSISILSQHDITIVDWREDLPYIVKRCNQAAAFACLGTGVSYAFTPEELGQFLFMLSLIREEDRENYSLELIEQIWLERPENKED